MADAFLEHVNITVKNSTKTAKTLCDLFGWKVRWQGDAIHGGTTIHVGEENSYIAIYTPACELAPAVNTYETRGGVNHIAVVVDDLDAVEAGVIAAGYEPCNHADYEPGKRFYFRDENQIEFEIVSY